MPELRQPLPPRAAPGAGQSLAQASADRPPVRYVAAEREAFREPPEITAARERYRAHTAAMEAEIAEAYARYRAAQDAAGRTEAGDE